MSVGVTESIAQIVAQASERLALLPEGGARGELIESLRRFMRLETERLRMRHRIGLGGDEIVAGRSQQVDLLCRRVCQWMAAELGPQAQAELVDVALVALGGYGREELAPFSDIDLLFLRAHESNRTVQSLVEGVLAMLWDIGFTVGHSFRSIAECVDIARGDLHARTAMAEARFLTGNAELYASFVGRLHEAVFQNASDTEAFISALRHETEARYERYGRSVGLLEPHIKEGAGGLRDLHSLSWLAHARFGEGRLERLLAGGQLSEREFKALWRARGFLARVRNEAHFLTGRKTDRLTLDLQTEMATHLGYVHTRQRSTSEELMRDYYERADDLHAVFTSFAVRNGLFARRRPSPWRRLFARRRRHFEVHAGALHLPRDTREDQGAPSSPRLTLEAFAMMQAAGVDLSDEVKVAIR
ncbi:MAG: DUF294 nucleotidyltransferase-like domain-containing protein, partial [Vicinamibacteria bacterium]|nr:DUF294 nucleotidyltransferase-like domain-containing protein [Vicinamibacteria bacterium]